MAKKNDLPDEVIESAQDILNAWPVMQQKCPYRNSDRDAEMLCTVCEHPDNRMDLETCAMTDCPLLDPEYFAENYCEH